MSLHVPEKGATFAERVQCVRFGRLGDGKSGIDHVFETREGGYAVGFNFYVPSLEASPGSHQMCAALVQQIVDMLPERYCLQVVRGNFTNLRESLTPYFEVETSGAVSELLQDERLQFVYDAQSVGLPTSMGTPTKASVQKGYIFIHSPPLGLYDKPLFGANDIDRKILEFTSTIASVKELLESSLGAVWQINASWLADYYVSILNPVHARVANYFPALDGDDLPEAIAACIELRDIQPNGFVSVQDGQQTHFRVVSMLWKPKSLISCALLETVEDASDCVSVTNIRVMPQAATTFAIAAKKFVNVRMSTPFNAATVRAIDDDLTVALERNAKYKDRWVQVRTHVIVTDATKQAVDERAMRVQLKLNAQVNMESGVEDLIGSSLLINGCLPFTPEKFEGNFSRNRRMLTTDAVKLIPLGGSWEGLTSARDFPYCAYFNRWSKPVLVNPMLADANSNMVVVGGSGSGKSYFVHDMVLQMARLPNVFQYLVSVKQDYFFLAKTFGEVVTFNVDTLPCLNPFVGEATPTNRQTWKDVIRLALLSADPAPVTSDEQALLDYAVMEAYHFSHQRTANAIPFNLEDVCAHLTGSATESRATGERLVRRLRDYRKDGMYGALLNGQPTLSKSSRLIFFNLGGIMSTQAGQVVIASLMKFFDDVMTMPERTGIPKQLIFDEGSFLVDEGMAGRFLDKAARTYRSFGGLVGGISQELKDWQTGFGRAMLANSATKYVCKQADKDQQDSVIEILGLNDAQAELVRSLKLKSGYFGEVFVSCSGAGSTVLRVYAMPLHHAISTTNPNDVPVRQELLEQYSGDYVQAIKEFARRFPHGVRHGEKEDADEL